MSMRTAFFSTLLVSIAACGVGTSPLPSPKEATSGSTTGGGTTGATAQTTGGDTGGATTAAKGTTVSGTVQAAPFDGNSVAMTDIKVALVDPNTTPPTLLGSMDLDSATCTATGCPFSLPDIDLSKVTAGVAVVTMDSRTAGAVWQPTATATANQNVIAAAISKGELANQDAYAIDTNGLVAMAAVSKTKDANTLVTAGCVVGIIVGNANDANGITPITGAKVTVPTNVKASYPDATFTKNNNSTTDTGLFFAVPTAAAVTGAYTPTGPAADKTDKWAATTVVMVPGAVVVFKFESE